MTDSEKHAPTKNASAPESGFLETARKRAERAYQRERQNMEEAYEDLEFRAGDQWPEYAKRQRESERRPILTINRIPQFVHQITGDIRLMKPAIKVVPIDQKAMDVKTEGVKSIGDLRSGMIRYIENRSESQIAYSAGADSQVCCGMGAWRVQKEYAAETTFNQELRIAGVDDAVALLWDPDAKLPTREDSQFCFVPVDMSRDAYQEAYPDAPVDDFTAVDKRYHFYWFGSDFVRVAEYWEKRPVKRTLALMKDGTVNQLSDDITEKEIAELKKAGARIEKRDGFKVFRSVISVAHVLEEPEEWPGSYIPIVPVIGEEVRIGRKVFRHGIVRFAKDAQRMYNYARSAQTELVGVAPKSPWVGTEKNFKDHMDMWQSANAKNWPALMYTPDPLNGGREPSRVAPPIPSSGISELVAISDNDMKATTGIYDASLGNRSNEQSGVAIKARQQEGDVGSVTYSENFALAIRHTGRILNDLIPAVYDAERQIQIIGVDGKEQLISINKAIVDPAMMLELEDEAKETDEEDAEEAEGKRKDEPMINDMTVGAYAVVVEMGPSYTTRREEAKEGMVELIKNAPQIFPMIGDLYVRAQDWPMAEDISERLETLLPPPVQAMIAAKKNGGQVPPQMMQPPQPPPDPHAQAEMAKVEAEKQRHTLKMEAETQKHQADMAANAQQHEFDMQLEAIKLEIAKVQLATATATAQAKMVTPAGIQTTEKPMEKQPGDLQAMTQHLARLHGMVDQLAEHVHGQPITTPAPMPGPDQMNGAANAAG